MSTWQQHTDESLIAYAEAHRDAGFSMAPAMEMQRRVMVAIREFNQQSRIHTEKLIALAEETTQQNDLAAVKARPAGVWAFPRPGPTSSGACTPASRRKLPSNIKQH